MALTSAQKTALKTNILANTNTIVRADPGHVGENGQIKDVCALTGNPPTFVIDSPENFDRVATWYNLLASPAFYAWYFTRSRMDNRRAILNTAGAGNQLDALTGSKRDSLLWLLDDTVEPKLASVRATIDDLTAAQATLKAAILDSFKRQLTNVQKVLVTGGGNGAFATPADGGFEGSVNGSEIADALLNG